MTNSNDLKSEILQDYYLACLSRQASLMGRKETLSGKAKFGIFGDGKELAQIALSKIFKNGDFRSGYYRDQTLMMAAGLFTPQQMFAGLYAHADLSSEPTSGGRQMVNHFSTHLLNEDGTWKTLTEQKNSASDISCTAGQMPRLLGLAEASKVYREVPQLKNKTQFSINGNEIAFGTIGNASTSEGHFFETMNAAAVMQVPVVMSIWDDGYGISVPAKYQTAKESISEIMSGFQRTKDKKGIEIINARGWNYPELVQAYQKAEKIAREEHCPVLVHITEVTQPQGHSTSGSHERYKTPDRLQWEIDFDGISRFKKWILDEKIADEKQLDELEKKAVDEVKKQKDTAWKAFQTPIKMEQGQLLDIINKIENESSKKVEIKKIIDDLKSNVLLFRKNNLQAARKILRIIRDESISAKQELKNWISEIEKANDKRYGTHIYSQTDKVGAFSPNVPAKYSADSTLVDGRIILRDNFNLLFAKYPELLTFGEDTGNIGDVNQGMEGMQEKYGEARVFDVGIREATIIGQAIGLAMRGLRPIAEIQYLDYILYGLQTMSDDLATLHYRSCGTQKAPAIIRTRGHRLEGIWHSGSPISAMISLLRGLYVLVPRNMTKAAGFYNNLMDCDNPALVIECLNGYRKKEKMPENLSEIRTPIGVAEVVKQGSDVTIVSYGSTFAIVEQAVEELETMGISCELIDVQSLLPFDLTGAIGSSVKKTSRLVIIDEDMPSSTAGYILTEVLEKQKAYNFLDSIPLTITAKPQRPPYADDGDYYAKPNIDDIVEKIYELIRETNPKKYQEI